MRNELTKDELNGIIGGGSSLSGTFINSMIKAFSLILDFGRTIGSAIRYKTSSYMCYK